MVTIEYRKNYYEQNKERILKTMNRPVVCEYCKRNIKFSCWNKHCKTKKHLKAVTESNEIKINKTEMDELQKQLKALKEKVETLEKSENI